MMNQNLTKPTEEKLNDLLQISRVQFDYEDHVRERY